MSVRKIVRHIYNARNDMFCPLDIEDVKRDVTSYLTRKSKTPTSIIEHGEQRGVYRLNLNSRDAQQLVLQFKADEEEDTPPPPDTTSGELSLFDF